MYVNDDGNENTRDIVIEDNWCSELISFGSQQPSTENIRATESSELMAIDRDNFKKLMETVPQFDKVYKQILEASYANSVYRINTFVSLFGIRQDKMADAAQAIFNDKVHFILPVGVCLLY